MRPDNRRIDHLQRDITCATSGKRLQDHVEDAAIGPASKLPEDRIPVAKFLRQVTPRRARPHLPKNRIKHTAMVARRSATTSDKERFKIRPLIVRHQPANHSCSPQRTALNQFTILQSITLSTAPSTVLVMLLRWPVAVSVEEVVGGRIRSSDFVPDASRIRRVGAAAPLR
jgi:hypothetical protein